MERTSRFTPRTYERRKLNKGAGWPVCFENAWERHFKAWVTLDLISQDPPAPEPAPMPEHKPYRSSVKVKRKRLLDRIEPMDMVSVAVDNEVI